MPNNSVLHGYYPLGGESIAKELVKIDHQFNARVDPSPFGIQEDIPITDSEQDFRIAQSVRSVMLPSFRHSDVDDLKLSLFYAQGTLARIQFLTNRLQSNSNASQNIHERQKSDMPWGKRGIAEYIKSTFLVGELVFNGASYEYEGMDGAKQPSGGLRLILDPESEQNRQFFQAQAMCVRGLIAVVGRRVKIETANSLRIGKINMLQTSAEQVEAATQGISDMLREEPISARVGIFSLKQRS
jgi:hypothetical protein